jgi:hypothetical protein
MFSNLVFSLDKFGSRATVEIEASRKERDSQMEEGTPPGYQRPQSEDGASSAAAGSK